MKTTIDIPEKVLKDAIKFTGAKTKREAVNTAVAEYNRRCRVERLIEKFGTMDGIMTQVQLQKMREDS